MGNQIIFYCIYIFYESLLYIEWMYSIHLMPPHSRTQKGCKKKSTQREYPVIMCITISVSVKHNECIVIEYFFQWFESFNHFIVSAAFEIFISKVRR